MHGHGGVDLAQPSLGLGERGLDGVGRAAGSLGSLGRGGARIARVLELDDRRRLDGPCVREHRSLAIELAQRTFERRDPLVPLLELGKAPPARRRARAREPALGRLGGEGGLTRGERRALDLVARLLGGSQRLGGVMSLGPRDGQRALARARGADRVTLRGQQLDGPARRRVPLAARERRLERSCNRTLLVRDGRELALAHDQAALEDRT